MLIFGRGHLERVLRTYTAHYNERRRIEALSSRRRCVGLIRLRRLLKTPGSDATCTLGGLIHEYELAA